MSKKNKFYWFEGVTKKGVEALLNDENSKYRWLRPQRNRRVLVIFMSIGLVLTSMGSYWPTLKTNLNLSPEVGIVVYSITAIFVILATVGCYSFLRIAVRSIGNDGSYVVIAALFACAALPSMVMAWRERDI